jgi:hypothetical protein
MFLAAPHTSDQYGPSLNSHPETNIPPKSVVVAPVAARSAR